MLEAWVAVLNTYFLDDIQSDCFTVLPGQQTDNMILKSVENRWAKQTCFFENICVKLPYLSSKVSWPYWLHVAHLCLQTFDWVGSDLLF